MGLPILAVIAGIGVLLWSADRFVEGSAATARHLGMPSLLIGMVVVGFGTSVPEMVVSVFAAVEGSPGIAIGNAYGSNVANIGLVLGLTALISPIAVKSAVVRRELPILVAITGMAFYQAWDGELTRFEAFVLLGVFVGLMGWTIREGVKEKRDEFGREVEADLDARAMSVCRAWVWLILGFALLLASSRALVWGAVELARVAGVSDLIVGLTVVALGTSLPELASSLMAIRRKEHDIALGNVLGSNLFNTLAVVGIAGAIQPVAIEPEVLSRDMSFMGALTAALFLICLRARRPQRINRIEGTLLLASYVAYMGFLAMTAARSGSHS